MNYLILLFTLLLLRPIDPEIFWPPDPPECVPEDLNCLLKDVIAVEEDVPSGRDLFTRTPTWELGGIMEGEWSHYDQGPSDATEQYAIANGFLPENLPNDRVLISHGDCGRAGTQLWVSISDGPWLEAWVFDCAGHWEGLIWLANNGFLGELDYHSAERYGRLHQGGVLGKMSYERPF